MPVKQPNETSSALPRRTLRLAGDAEGVAEAAGLLRAGGLVAFPTETVYGLGADATDPRVVAGVFAAKARPSFNPLIAHCADAQAAMAVGRFDDAAMALAEAFWPGPLTLVVPATDDCPVCDLARAGLATVALRVPEHPIAHALLATVGRPVAAPSANRSGRISPTTAEHVLADLDGALDAVIDGGSTMVGVESTIVVCLDGRVALLRPGGIAREAVEAVIGVALAPPSQAKGAPLGPGMLASHYAPRALVRLDATDVRADEAWLGFGMAEAEGTPIARETLSASGDLREAAAHLFAALRRLDASGARAIAVAPIPDQGLGEAINDRLRRAAAPREAAT